MKKIAEVLAPAGSFDTFKAVLNAGADAVYLAGQSFGARAYAGNLSDEELLEAIDYSHIHDKKLYVTVNTLLKNNELFRDLYDYIRPLYEHGLDAVIVQDYGVMKFINDNFPGLDIHASTQMTITEPGYLDFLEKYNVTRIVPARELSLGELKVLAKKCNSLDNPVEIETFVHGALCYCYSGQCLMSSFYGGRSGNRGRCAGTCRLNFSGKGTGDTLLSLKDLNTLEILPQIIDAGVYSLKIEGRMKSTVYAAGITSIYRKYVDKIASGEKYSVEKSDLDNLLMLFDRGGVTKGYYVMHNGREMLACEKSDKSQTQKSDFEKEILQKYANGSLKETVNMSASFCKGSNAVLNIYNESVCNTAEGAPVVKADKRPLSEADFVRQLSKLGQTDFIVDNIEISAEDDVFISNKEINELRRSAVSGFRKMLLAQFARECPERTEYSFEEVREKYTITAQICNISQAGAALEAGAKRLYVDTEFVSLDDIVEIRQLCRNEGAECVLDLPRVFRMDYNSFIEDNIDTLRMLSFNGIMIRNMAQLGYVRKYFPGVRVVSDYTIYAFNNLDCEVLNNEGIDDITLPVELNSGELKHICAKNRELIVYMKQPLMVSAGCIEQNTSGCRKNIDGVVGSIMDRKKIRLSYAAVCKYCYNIIFNSIPTYIADKTREISEIAPRYLRFVFFDESAEQIKKIMSRDAVLDSYTRGHFNKGVE